MRPRPVRTILSLLAPVLLTGCLTINNEPPEPSRPSADAGKAAAGGQRAGDDGPFEPWGDVLEHTTEVDGYFTLHEKRDNTLYMEVPEERLGEDFGLVLHYSQGLGDMGIQEGGNISPTQMLRFRRSGQTLYLVRRNPRFRADSGSAMETSMEDNVGHSTVASFDIESRHDSTGAYLVDVTDFLVSDYGGTGDFLEMLYEGRPPRLDRDRSHVGSVQSFPRNTEVEVRLTYEASGHPAFGGPGVSDPSSVPVGVRYSFFRLPEDPMEPRLADQRVGHFLTTVEDFSADRSTDPYRRFVNRWRLEKKNPDRELSEPVEPIVFYVDRSVPKRYREYVAEGIEAWNEAFRKAGFENAVEARMPPDDSTWSAEDIRYSTVRWNAAHNMGYAVGPSQVDPRTGEILNADILVDAAWLRSWLTEYRNMVAGPAAGLPGIRAPADAGGLASDDAAGPGGDRLRRALLEAAPGGARRLCFAASRRGRQMALQYATLAARGEVAPGEPMPEEYVAGAIRDLVMHEVGHTLGLRHNFKASTAIPNDSLHDESYTGEHGVSLSVMDYVPVNLAADSTRQGHYWNPGVGTYDEWAIRYAYAPVYRSGGDATLAASGDPVRTASAERPALKELAGRGTDSMHVYATDEDAYLGVDPRVNTDDLGSDPLEFARTRNRIIDGLMPRLADRLVGEGDGWHRLREGFDALLYSRFYAVMPATKLIGGLYTSRDRRGQPDARPPFRAVPAERQREALDLIVREVLAEDAYDFDPAQLNRLAPNLWSDWSRSPGELTPMAYPVHGRVESMQSTVLSTLLSPDRLSRVSDNRVRAPEGTDVLGIAELFDRLTEAAWSELEDPASPSPIDSFRRNLQRSHLEQLQALLLNDEMRTPGGPVSVPEDARSLARHEMREILSRVEGALESGTSLDDVNRAHLEETEARIERALRASVTLPADGDG